MKQLTILSLALLGVFGSTSCTEKWQAPTYIVLENLDESLHAKMRASVASFGVQPLDEQEAADLRVGPDDYAFRLSGLGNTQNLADAMSEISAVYRKNYTSGRLSHAVLVYSGVNVEGTAGEGSAMSASGRATAGSRVRLDAGGSELLVFQVGEDGRWNLPVESSEKLQERGGWLYGEAERNGTSQYFRLNLLSASEPEEIDQSDVPGDSLLRR